MYNRSFMLYTDSVMLSPRFIPGSIFYMQSVMFSPCFIPESVFYVQSVVRSPSFILTSEGIESMVFIFGSL